MDTYTQAARAIIKEQQAIIGPLAVDQARKVQGLEVKSLDEVKITGDGKSVINELVKRYAQLFGQISVQVCKDAFKAISPKLPTDQIPDILKS